MYNKEELAIRYVVKKFEGIRRIKEDIDMCYHSLIVGNMLKSINASEEVILTGYLHDIIEDTNGTYEEISEMFGKVVADNVLIISENIDIKDWKERKEHFLRKIKNASENILLVELADKYHNLMSDYDAWIEKGSDALVMYNRSFELGKWFYLELYNLFNNRLKSSELLDRFNKIINLYYKQ